MDPDQTAPLALFAYMQNVSLKSLQEDTADDISRRHKQMTFSDADFLGALRVKQDINIAWLAYKVIIV